MVDEEDVVTTATKEVLDRITGQRFNLVKVRKARQEEMTYMRRLTVWIGWKEPRRA